MNELAHTPDIVLTEIARDEKYPDRMRIRAADILLDRIEGKPRQTINADIRRSAPPPSE